MLRFRNNIFFSSKIILIIDRKNEKDFKKFLLSSYLQKNISSSSHIPHLLRAFHELNSHAHLMLPTFRVNPQISRFNGDFERHLFSFVRV